MKRAKFQELEARVAAFEKIFKAQGTSTANLTTVEDADGTGMDVESLLDRSGSKFMYSRTGSVDGTAQGVDVNGFPQAATGLYATNPNGSFALAWPE